MAELLGQPWIIRHCGSMPGQRLLVRCSPLSLLGALVLVKYHMIDSSLQVTGDASLTTLAMFGQVSIVALRRDWCRIVPFTVPTACNALCRFRAITLESLLTLVCTAEERHKSFFSGGTWAGTGPSGDLHHQGCGRRGNMFPEELVAGAAEGLRVPASSDCPFRVLADSQSCLEDVRVECCFTEGRRLPHVPAVIGHPDRDVLGCFCHKRASVGVANVVPVISWCFSGLHCSEHSSSKRLLCGLQWLLLDRS